MVHCVRKYTGRVVCLRWRGDDESLWSQPKFGFPKGRSASAVVGWWSSERCDEKSQGSLVAPEAIGLSPYRIRICEGVGCLGRGP